MPVKVTPDSSRTLGAEIVPFDVPASDPDSEESYSVGVGVAWKVGADWQVGFMTVAHPFWGRPGRPWYDVVQFPEVSPAFFWLRKVYVPDRAELNLDASVHRLALLTDDDFGTSLAGLHPVGTDDDRRAVELRYGPGGPHTPPGVVPADAIGPLAVPPGAVLCFSRDPAPQCRINHEFPGPMPDNDGVVQTGKMAGLIHAIRAFSFDGTKGVKGFVVGKSGQPWTLSAGNLLAIQFGIDTFGSRVPCRYGYGVIADAAVRELRARLGETVPGYVPNSLRIVSCF